MVGAAIGFEREAHGQAAGLRTFILVSVGACLMMMLSLEMEEIHRHLAVDQSVVRLDPARIASYAIASMGFLGAGAIITGKGSVRGLTTAAGLWLATGLGLAIGAGYLIPALFAAGISLIILYALRLIKKGLRPRSVHHPDLEISRGGGPPGPDQADPQTTIALPSSSSTIRWSRPVT